MADVEYRLRCPRCGAQQRLERRMPHERRRCGTCGAIVEVPPLEEPRAAGGPPPLVRRRLASSLLRLGALALASTLAASVAVLWLWKQARQELLAPSWQAPLDRRRLSEWNPTLPIPLIPGLSWTYRTRGGATFTVVVGALEPQEGGITCRVREVRGSEERARLLMIREDGYYLLEESVGAVEWRLAPPLKVLPRVPERGFSWRGTSVATGPQGQVEEWSVEGRVDVEHGQITPLRTFPMCWAVRTKWRRGEVVHEDRVWYAPGFGPVRWTRPSDPEFPEVFVAAQTIAP